MGRKGWRNNLNYNVDREERRFTRTMLKVQYYMRGVLEEWEDKSRGEELHEKIFRTEELKSASRRSVCTPWRHFVKTSLWKEDLNVSRLKIPPPLPHCRKINGNQRRIRFFHDLQWSNALDTLKEIGYKIMIIHQQNEGSFGHAWKFHLP